MRVSDYYKLDRGQGELDFVDVDIRGDTRLYVDPRAARLLTTDWGNECVSLIQHFFRTVLDAIREGRDDDSKRLLSGLREPNETHLGLSRGRAQGSGLGPELAVEVYEALSETEAAVTGLLQDLEEAALLAPGIDRDRISDIATNIIRERLLRTIAFGTRSSLPSLVTGRRSKRARHTICFASQSGPELRSSSSGIS